MIKELIHLIRKYISSKEAVESFLESNKSNLADINFADLDEEEQKYIDNLFQITEPVFFEILLDNNLKKAKEYLILRFLGGENVDDKAKYQTNLDVMLDDLKEKIGDEEFYVFISSLPAKTLEHKEVLRALMFAYDVDNRNELPSW